MGYEVPPSDANFVMVKLTSPEEAARVNQELLRAGIIVRPLGSFGIPEAIRISTGSDEDNQCFIEALSHIQYTAPNR
jgi:histidinol-phosphate aminotransferase